MKYHNEKTQTDLHDHRNSPNLVGCKIIDGSRTMYGLCLWQYGLLIPHLVWKDFSTQIIACLAEA